MSVDCTHAGGDHCWHKDAPPFTFGTRPKCSLAAGATHCPWQRRHLPVALNQERSVAQQYAREQAQKNSDKLHAIFKDRPVASDAPAIPTRAWEEGWQAALTCFAQHGAAGWSTYRAELRAKFLKEFLK